MGACSSSNNSVVNDMRKRVSSASNLAGSAKQGSGTIAENLIKKSSNKDIKEYYEIESTVLGEGFGGEVRSCMHKETKIRYALKAIPNKGLDAEHIGYLKEEIRCISLLDHPNIIRVHEVFEMEDFTYLIMDLCTGGHLLQHLIDSHYKIKEIQACRYVHTILSAVIYCHAHNIVHRDLKLENILWEGDPDNSDLKLIDFGLSQYVHNCKQKMTLPVGTPNYVAPEVIGGKYDSKCDIWSLGVIAYILLSGRDPFRGDSIPEILGKISRCRWEFEAEHYENAGPEARDFIMKCFTPNSKWRPTAQDLLSHPWFTVMRAQHRRSLTASVSLNAISFHELKSDERGPGTPDENGDVVVATEGSAEGTGISMEEEGKLYESPLPSPHIMGKLGQFSTHTALSRILLDVLAHNLLPNQVTHLKTQFDLFDVDGTGEITVAQLRTIIAQMEGNSEEGTKKLIDSLDMDNNGRISYHEFLAATIGLQEVEEKNLLIAFDRMSSHTTCITKSSLKKLLGNTKYDVEKVLKEAGIERHESINYEKFKTLMSLE